jgi:hypothetical protein
MRDLGDEEPTYEVMSAWCEAKSLIYGIPASQVRGVTRDYFKAIDRTVRQELWRQAERIARAAGATRAKAFHRLNSAMDATKIEVINVNGVLTATPEPDHRVRVDAAKALLDRTAPARVDVTVDAGQNLRTMHDNEIKMRLVELQERAAKLLSDQ